MRFKPDFEGDTPFARALRQGIEATGGSHGTHRVVGKHKIVLDYQRRKVVGVGIMQCEGWVARWQSEDGASAIKTWAPTYRKAYTAVLRFIKKVQP